MLAVGMATLIAPTSCSILALPFAEASVPHSQPCAFSELDAADIATDSRRAAMSKPSPEQQRIAELELALEVALYWLLLAQDGGIKSVATSRAVEVLLANHGLAPQSAKAKALLRKAPQAYHFELENAVKRALAK